MSAATGDDASRDRRERELAANLTDTRERIARACATAGRSAGEVTLIAVTKTFPAADVRMLAGLGVGDVGENRADELLDKAPACADLRLDWHFVGQLQTNKATRVARMVDVVHSVDRPRLVDALARASARRLEEAPQESRLRCLVQVRLDDRAGRGGVPPKEVAGLAARIVEAPGLGLGGVMAVAPLEGAPEPAFERLAKVAAEMRDNHPEADWISAGMSEDLESAVRSGATHVRLGRALLGGRPSLR